MSDGKGHSTHERASTWTLPVGPVIAPPGEGAAAASRPDGKLEESRYNAYEANPVPWWISLLWLSFFVFGVIYLVTNLVSG